MPATPIEILLKPMHAATKPMNGFITRVASALARPYLTRYLTPTAKTVDAVLCALRGYDVFWSDVSYDLKEKTRTSSAVCYRCFGKGPKTGNERAHTHSITVPDLLPDWAYELEVWLRYERRAEMATRVAVSKGGK